jgi:hypothetical protein
MPGPSDVGLDAVDGYSNSDDADVPGTERGSRSEAGGVRRAPSALTGVYGLLRGGTRL